MASFILAHLKWIIYVAKLCFSESLSPQLSVGVRNSTFLELKNTTFDHFRFLAIIQKSLILLSQTRETKFRH